MIEYSYIILIIPGKKTESMPFCSLTTPPFPYTGTVCLQFAAYLYGQDVGELRVALVGGASPHNPPDYNYNYWDYTQTSIWSTEGTTPDFQTTTGTSEQFTNEGDILYTMSGNIGDVWVVHAVNVTLDRPDLMVCRTNICVYVCFTVSLPL